MRDTSRAHTVRQEQVLALLADGRSNKEIAARLGCSPRTVDDHVAALFDRYECHTRVELAVRYVQRNLAGAA